jgi:hypothetical protein
MVRGETHKWENDSGKHKSKKNEKSQKADGLDFARGSRRLCGGVRFTALFDHFVDEIFLGRRHFKSPDRLVHKLGRG